MADISKIQILDGTYDVKDSVARSNIGTLSNLNTSNKTNLVNAINEVNTKITSDDIAPFYCIIRPTSNGWVMLNDSGHSPLNVQSVEIDNGRLKITHSITGAGKVYGFSISPDETFTKYGIRAGASVGVDSSYIDIYQTITANAYFRYSGGTFNLQANFSNLVKEYEWDDTNHCLRVTFDDNLRCARPKYWTADFNYAPVQTSQMTTKLKALWVNYNIVEVYAFDEDNTLITDASYLDRVNVLYQIDSKIAPADLISYPISGSNFWICGYLKKTS